MFCVTVNHTKESWSITREFYFGSRDSLFGSDLIEPDFKSERFESFIFFVSIIWQFRFAIAILFGIRILVIALDVP